MRNLTILLAFIIVLIISIIKEPINDVADALAGSTNSTYTITLDSVAGATTGFYDDDDEEDDD